MFRLNIQTIAITQTFSSRGERLCIVRNDKICYQPESQVDSILRRHGANVFGAQPPDAILRQHVLDFINHLQAAVTPLVNVVHQTQRQVLTVDMC